MDRLWLNVGNSNETAPDLQMGKETPTLNCYAREWEAEDNYQRYIWHNEWHIFEITIFEM